MSGNNTMTENTLKLIKNNCYLDKAIFSEIVDINCLNELIKSEQLERAFDDNNYSQKFSATLYKNVTVQLEEYFNKTYDKKNNVFNVMYAKPRSKWGRVFPNKSLGLTSFQKKIRNTLIKGKYVDLDLSNAHPMILYNICEKNDIPCPIITEYINNREHILNNVMKYYNIDRDIAKKLFLRLTFFGTHNGFLKELKINTNTKPLTFITDFIDELKHVAELFKNENKALYDTARRQNPKNSLGSFFSMYLQEYETQIMSCVIEWLNDNTYVTTYKCKNKVLTYEFDGVKLLKENVDKYGIEKLKKDMEKVIFDQLGFNMVFEEKPIEKFYDIEYIPFEHQEIKPLTLSNIPITLTDEDISEMIKFISLTHEDIGSVFHYFYKDMFICGAEIPTPQWYMYNKGIWEELDGVSTIREKISREIVIKYIELKDILLINSREKNNDIFINFDIAELEEMVILCGNIIDKLKTVSFVNDIMKQCIYMFKVEKFIEKLDYNGYLLCFGEDVYDLEINEWRKTKQNDYCCRKCGMSKKDITDEHLDELNEIINNIFINENRREYFLNLTAEVLHGGNIKEIFQIWTGTGRNGKGLFMKYLEKALGSYFYTSDVSYLTQKTRPNGNANSELAQSRGVRVWSFTEPAQGAKLNNSLMKAITGGDIISARQLFQKSFNFLPQFTPIIQCNTSFGLQDVADDSIPDRLEFIKFNTRFVSNPSKSFEREKLVGIKTDKYANKIKGALMYLLLNRWKTLSDVNFKYTKPEEIQEDKQEFIDDNDDVKQFIDDKLMTTDNKEDLIKAKDLYDDYKDYINDKTGFKCKMNLKTFISRSSRHLEFRERLRIKGEDYRSVFISCKYKDNE
jgi:P4 family phage/plasmid primase-like protien